MSIVLLVLALASPCAATRVSSLRISDIHSNQSQNQVLDTQFPLFLRTLADSCECHYYGECSCPASMDFMRCISNACTSGNCECQETQFEHACKAMSSTCTGVGMKCSATQATCLYAPGDVVPAPKVKSPSAPAVVEKEVATVEEEPKKLEEAVSALSDESYWLPHATWVSLLLLTAVLRFLKQKDGALYKKRHVVSAALVVLWATVVAATYFFLFVSHKWSFLECLYFSVTTISTVGYGDYVPYYTTADKIAGIVFIWIVVGVLATCLSLVTSDVEDDVDEAEKSSGTQKVMFLHLGICGGFLVIGSFVFSYFEGWTHFDSLFFSLVTLSTVGYGSHEVATRGGMWSAIVFMLCAVPMFGAFMGSLGGHLDDKLTPFKKNKTKANLFCIYVAIILGWLFFGATGVWMLNTHGWDHTTCTYFSAVTMTTVGYGDFVPMKSHSDKVLTMVFIVLSVIVIATIFGDLNDMVIKFLTAGMDNAKAMTLQIGLLVGIIFGGGAVFMAVENWTFLEGIFYTTVTCTTVGYGHLLPSDHTSRMLASVFILLTVPMTGALVGNVSGLYQDKLKSVFGI